MPYMSSSGISFRGTHAARRHPSVTCVPSPSRLRGLRVSEQAWPHRDGAQLLLQRLPIRNAKSEQCPSHHCSKCRTCTRPQEAVYTRRRPQIHLLPTCEPGGALTHGSLTAPHLGRHPPPRDGRRPFRASAWPSPHHGPRHVTPACGTTWPRPVPTRPMRPIAAGQHRASMRRCVPSLCEWSLGLWCRWVLRRPQTGHVLHVSGAPTRTAVTTLPSR